MIEVTIDTQLADKPEDNEIIEDLVLEAIECGCRVLVTGTASAIIGKMDKIEKYHRIDPLYRDGDYFYK